jgi:alkyl hydroperoxide reductase subunit F
MVEEIAAQSDKVSARFDGTARARPSFAIRRADGGKRRSRVRRPADGARIHLADPGAAACGRPPAQGRGRSARFLGARAGRRIHFETFFSLSCQNCPDVVQALNIMAALNPNVSHVAIDGALFQDEVERARSWPCRWSS